MLIKVNFSSVKEFQHWLVVNIPGSNVKQGVVKSAYMRPGPFNATGSLKVFVF
jgi:hypothetical protein